MSKRKRNFDTSSVLDPSKKSFIYDEVDDFNDEQEDTYPHSSKVIKDQQPKEHVLAVGGYSDDDDESDDDESEDDAESEAQIEEEDDASEVDTDEDDDKELLEADIYSPAESGSDEEDDGRAMGKKKKFFFGTDLTDERLHKAAQHRGKKKEAESLELELKGTKELQERMRREIAAGEGEEDFSQLLLLPPKEDAVAEEEEEEEEEESSLPAKLGQIRINTSSLCFAASKAKAAKRLRKAAPEVIPLVADVKAKMEELRSKLSPLMEAKKQGYLPPSPATEYLQARYILCLNYLSVASGYMMLKFSGAEMTRHPAQARLAQYKHLFKELEVCESRFEPELDGLLADLESGKLKAAKLKSQRKMLGVLGEKKKRKRNRKKKQKSMEEAVEGTNVEEESSGEDEEEGAKDRHAVADASLGAEDRRKITYQIAKNKGLLPSRKKDQRNPRVKYKNKYQAKLKRRKGQVREVRREMNRYGGEISGIKKNVVKSVKLK